MIQLSCPRCGAHQKFNPRFREVAKGITIVQESYVKCTTCRWEKSLGRTTKEIEKTRRTIKGMERKLTIYEEKGKSANNLKRALGNQKQRLQKLKFEVGL